MPKMREVNKKVNAAKAIKAAVEYTMIEMNGQMVKVVTCKPNAAPKQITARC